MSPPHLPPGITPNLGGGRLFSHFTNAEGVTGITRIVGDNLEVSQQVIVRELLFGQGSNDYLAWEPGSIFVTELGIDATERQLNDIGVFGDKQNFAIQFSEEIAFLSNGIRVRGVMPSRSIFCIPGNTILQGTFLVTRVR
ncbi:MAG TPA: hypothetical protein DCL61_01820 [Cyanobacteria bacterium UBA12227]|nr:hypothetical protein [Cyanobacteria bacterium UBA12227]HAX88406.1 hypothetical protein [Cyanobacteria bacterium UBA11370]HBY75807.1 hypothetical protein [Cyanobacteria bacterium UBA11148]